ncbi:TIGR02530 family flagellar biosynthesis protein [Virgibacillus proomii]|uniref:TIGR02530 family flagellar biosynthesis protein n=1 Tax=Virgibacillus proomii TaxID=84407 RepID=UPI001C0FC944|nr:TIGR02530 family flagellar biosynthesis protein [Virgibacillus proomii]MBU5267794.1 flagellar protein [Virgibacillus proomii]
MNTLDHRILQAPQHPSFVTREVKKTNKEINSSFKDILVQEQLEQRQLKISKHAVARIQERKIEINAKQWQRIEAKLSEAKRKGINDSLVLLSDAALLVNARNNTVVTAMDRNEAEDRIFTNINGAILIND